VQSSRAVARLALFRKRSAVVKGADRVCTCPFTATPQALSSNITSWPNNTNILLALSLNYNHTFLNKLSVYFPSHFSHVPQTTSMSLSTRTSTTMSDTNTEKSHKSTGDQYCQSIVNDILVKLRDDPRSLTTEDARRLSENAVAGDMRTAKIISAVEAFAVASEVIHDVDPHLGQAPHTSLLTLINDLKVAVEQNPNDVTTEIFRTAQNVVTSRYAPRLDITH
jgi:hypothetical protein